MNAEQEQKRAWLNRAKTIERYIAALKKQVEKDKRLLDFLSEFNDPDVPGLVKKVEHSIQEQRKQMEELISIREEIRKAILEVQDDKLKTILTRHYLLYEPIDTISENMYCDRRSIQRNHLKALDRIMIHEVKGKSDDI